MTEELKGKNDPKLVEAPNGAIQEPSAPHQERKAFGGIADEFSNLKRAKVVVLQVPYERTTTYGRGTGKGPAAIINASANMELFDDELNQETYKVGINTMDCLEVSSLSPEEMVEKVRLAALEIIKGGKLPVTLGGEHTVTIGAVKACKEVFGNLSVLQLDAHSDLRDEYLGLKLNHACVGRRVSEICPLVQVGTRSLSREEGEFLESMRKQATREPGKENGAEGAGNGARIKIMSVYDILDMPLWREEVLGFLTENVYVTIDLDVFDPSLMSAVGTPEPGGMGWYTMLELLHNLAKKKNVVGFDVVELCPIAGQVAPDFLAAKLIYRFLGYIFQAKKQG